MSNKSDSKHLVIDASVVRSASDFPPANSEKKENSQSKNCRNFLEAIKDSCHCFVLTPEIRQEWNKHQSKFSATWRRTMIAKGKLKTIPTIPIDKELLTKIQNVFEYPNQRKAVTKDLHLIEAALATDKTIISLDDTAKQLFIRAAVEVHNLKNIVWVNPNKIEEEKPIEWLKNGAKPESSRTLGSKF